MNAGKSVSMALGWIQSGIGAFDLTGLYVGPTHQPHVIVKEEIPFSLSIAHQDSRDGTRPSLGNEPRDVQVREDIHIVDQERTALQKASGMTYPTSSLTEQVPLIGDGNLDSKVVLLLQVIDYLVREMMDIHNHIIYSRILQAGDNMTQQRLSSHWDESLRHGVSQWFEPGPKTCGENKGFHLDDPLNVQLPM